ncbi:SCO2400 family protein [Streptomyces sp. NBC_00820]|uniref:SCO2400 family protein n=1 Tax=Streptomyces sp. NBC_00820 TaxID=2975842 RepID=UPI003FA7CC4D
MDYCSSCRRHLNGALVCPGCGAYAPDIAPVVTTSRGYTAATPESAMRDFDLFGTPASSDGTPVDGAPRGSAPLDGDPVGGPVAGGALDGAPRFHPSGDVKDAPAAAQGRAARRRQLVRWKKNKRRAAVATAVALVGGGLTLASMERQSTDRTQAAAAPDNRGMGGVGAETTADDLPVTTPPGTQGAPHTSNPAHAPSRGAGPSHGQSARATHTAQAPQAATTAAGTDPSNAHTDSAAPTLPVRTPATVPHTSAPAAAATSGGTATSGTGSASASASSSGTASQQPASTPAASSPGATDSATPQVPSTPAATSPAHLCLLGLVCLS